MSLPGCPAENLSNDPPASRTPGSILFIAGLAWAASPWASPPLALAAGLIIGLLFTHAFRAQANRFSKVLLKLSVIGLGFGMQFQSVLRAGRTGLLYTAFGIAFAMSLGIWLGRVLRVQVRNAYLIAVGTAICGGSAIAAVAKVSDASDEEIGISLGAVFILNSVALLLFPLLGTAAHLTQTQFGLWAALAIHDTSSVVGAGAKYGAVALAVATTVKLARALWIFPVTLGTAAMNRTRARVDFPWFVVFFVFAAILNSYVPAGRPAYHFLSMAARAGLTATLFLIGTNITRDTLSAVGPRPLIHATVLWFVVGSVSLALILQGWIGL